MQGLFYSAPAIIRDYGTLEISCCGIHVSYSVNLDLNLVEFMSEKSAKKPSIIKNDVITESKQEEQHKKQAVLSSGEMSAAVAEDKMQQGQSGQRAVDSSDATVMQPGRQVLPLITLRGIIVTPYSNVQILAAREQSIAACAYALDRKQSLAVFCQLNDADEHPDFESLLNIGVICKVREGAYKDPDSYRCVICGFDRIRLVRVIDSKDKNYREAEVELIPAWQPAGAEDQRRLKHYLDALQASLLNAMKNSRQAVRPLIDKSVPKEVLTSIEQENSLLVLTDVLTQILQLDMVDKRLLLCENNPLERAKVLISLLNGYSYREELNERICREAKISMERNQREYYLNEQLKAIKHELKVDYDEDADIEEYRQKLKALKAPAAVRNKIDKEISKLAIMSINSSENIMVRNYIDTLLSIPWEVGSEVNKDLLKAQRSLDADHYGLEKVKDRILEYLAVQARADNLHGPIICLMGPPGIGKTSLGASIAKATGRKYVRVSLGGLHDEAEIRGHRRTYIGSLPGRIMQNLIKAGVNNPLFVLDEIDKIGSDGVHGDPSAALLEVLDPEQNKSFADNYVELEYDLSKVMFVATANSYNIPGPLLDRMEVIDLSTYTEEEKFNIAKKYLLPKQLRANALTEAEFALADEALTELIRYYTHEAGVRGLERLINELCRKTVKDKILKEARLKAAGKKVQQRRTVLTVKQVGKLLGPRRYDFTSKLEENKVGLVNGLAWTSLGGDILQLEAVANEGTGKHQLTGKLGEVMKESISAAITVVRKRAGMLHLKQNFYEKCDLHIHVPEGATPKEGPSAGIGMVTAVVSALTGNPVRADVAMTGEITLRGDVLPIGGLKEKLLAALRGGIKLVLIPKENEKDLWDIPQNVKKGLEIVPVSHIDEVLSRALVNDPTSFMPQSPWAQGVLAEEQGAGHGSAVSNC